MKTRAESEVFSLVHRREVEQAMVAQTRAAEAQSKRIVARLIWERAVRAQEAERLRGERRHPDSAKTVPEVDGRPLLPLAVRVADLVAEAIADRGADDDSAVVAFPRPVPPKTGKEPRR